MIIKCHALDLADAFDRIVAEARANLEQSLVASGYDDAAVASIIEIAYGEETVAPERENFVASASALIGLAPGSDAIQ